jgi:osmoprotectant transport system permease protein
MRAVSIARFPKVLAFDKLGVIIAAIIMAGLFLQPFALLRANRIVAASPKMLWDALPSYQALPLAVLLVAAALFVLLRTPTTARLVVSITVLVALILIVGHAASFLTPPDNRYARVSPGGGFWILEFAFAIAMADAVVRKSLGPFQRIGFLLLAIGVGWLLLFCGALDDLSILKEYTTRASAFWREAHTHIILAGGSLLVAALIGIPVGILCFRTGSVRAPILNSLNVVQTIPSIALFGLLIAPLAWVARNVPGASLFGIAGIGMAPAFIALVAYALLPIVSNTLAGLEGVSPSARDAARGMGMTSFQRLVQVEMPLAFPVILTGIRIVLVQNIGLAAIAALIGGGGLGTFVFQGISQTAADLVLLGALPIVGMSFAAAIILDALVELSQPRRNRTRTA